VKVGDLVRYTKEHSSRPGYDYCATWIGLIFQYPDDPPGDYRIYWTTQHGSHVGDWFESSDGWQGLEIINGNR